MGKQKYQKEILEFFKKSPVVDFSSIRRIIKEKTPSYTKQLVRNLIIQGKISKLAKGYYTIHDDNSLIVFCFKPSYLGLQHALSFHNLWEQETNPIVITTRKIRQGVRVVMGRNVILRKIDKKYIFGFDYYLDGDFYLPYSDVEKTFIDMVYFRQPLDKEVITNFKKKIDKKKLSSYLKNYPIKLRRKVSGLLG
jgi:predicted transcriptional regulator of viral defense system